MIGAPVHLQERRVFNVSEERNRQARKQLWLPSTFVIVEASPVLNYFSGLGVVQIPLPPGEFLVGMQDPAGARRFGMVRFEGIHDLEGWEEHA
ncbi:hypothetical protein ABR147_001531 [Pseudomonas aeruginosa]|uniref:hypothetical protein n=1 Tax=Pseudomonas aeruginosa TaxID=287 RepID=UPI00044DE204|nr:hypothetical protein [Pseudomonas aeruginosa]SVK36422.1 Uncharacterised protein [Acinetobacter baumannii]EIU6915710.1 hypothetical protein [Pseudomonas aeruginosa]EKF8202772.1 hypothetical protein [Pseudomonas aeruginosa]EKI0102547.1 hypothetical protein [Pseudomonas aeruginosa]EKI0125510.1 hypothetical protein [Pseudomonas aeruginosa]